MSTNFFNPNEINCSLPCTDTLQLVRGLAPYRDSESCDGNVQPRGRGRVG